MVRMTILKGSLPKKTRQTARKSTGGVKNLIAIVSGLGTGFFAQDSKTADFALHFAEGAAEACQLAKHVVSVDFHQIPAKVFHPDSL